MDFSLITSPIRSFQSMVQCAANTAESIPREDMLMAFRTSLNLLERIGELMNLTNNSTKSSPNGFIKSGIGINQNSFLNSFTSNNTNNANNSSIDFCSQSSPSFRQQQESILFSNRMSFSSSDALSGPCILPISSSPSFATLNGLMKGGGLQNNEAISNGCDSNMLTKSSSNETSVRGNDFQFLLTNFINNNNIFPTDAIKEEENSGRDSEDQSAINLPYLSMATTMSENTLPTETALWNNRPLSPIPSNLPKEPELSDELINTINHRRFTNFSARPRSEHRKNLNSDELNRLLDSCEVRTSGAPGKKNYKCKFCGKMYDIKSSIRYHIRIIHLKMHLKTADMQCKLCGRVFTCATAANKHQLRCLKSSGQTEDLSLKTKQLSSTGCVENGTAQEIVNCSY